MENEGGEHNRQNTQENISLAFKKYGDLKVVNNDPINRRGHRYWLCRCQCGSTEYIDEQLLTSGKRVCCINCIRYRSGKRRRRRINDTAGRRFGRLIAIEPSAQRERNGNVKWLCKCDCGNFTVVGIQELKHGKTLSCGCLRSYLRQIYFNQNPAMAAYIGNTANFVNEDGVYISSINIGKRNRSGVIGVSYDKKAQRWIARLRFNGKYVLNKACTSKKEAIRLRHEAERKYLHLDQSD